MQYKETFKQMNGMDVLYTEKKKKLRRKSSGEYSNIISKCTWRDKRWNFPTEEELKWQNGQTALKSFTLRGRWEWEKEWREGVLVRGDLGGSGEVYAGKGLDLEELSGGAEGRRGAEDKLGELFNRPLKQGLLTLLTTPALGLPQLAKHPRDSLCTHPAAPGNLTLSI